MSSIVSAVFATSAQAEVAVQQLRAHGVPDAAITVVAQNQTVATPSTTVVHETVEEGATGSGVATGIGVGAGLGAIFGLAAAIIPGVGPFIAAGALANAVGMAGAGAVAGAVVGGVAGGLAEALESYGVPREEAVYYAEEVNRGGVFVGVATENSLHNEVVIRDILTGAGGRTGPYMA